MSRQRYFKYSLMILPLVLSATSYAIFCDPFSKVLLVAKALTLVYLLFCTIQRNTISRYELGIVFYLLSYLISISLNDGQLFSGIKEMAMVLSYCLLIKNSVEQSNDDMQAFLKSCSDIFTLVLVVNAFLLILYPKGLFGAYARGEAVFTTDPIKTRYNFLGLDNATTPIVLFALAVWSITNRVTNRRRVVKLIEFFAVAANAILLRSSTFLVALLVIVGGFFLYKLFNYVPNTRTMFFCAFFLFVLIVMMNAQELFSFFIVDVLHKDLSLTSRTTIWKKTIEYVSGSPIIGHGVGNFAFVYSDRNAHNMYLQLMAQTGIIGICIVMILLLSADHASGRSKDGNWLLMQSLLALLVCCLSEVYYSYWLFGLFYLVYQYNKTIRSNNKV